MDGELVSDKKLLLYVNIRVISRAAKRKKRIRTNNVGDAIISTITEKIVEQEVFAIISLWNFQYSSLSYLIKKPLVRSEALKILLKSNL